MTQPWGKTTTIDEKAQGMTYGVWDFAANNVYVAAPDLNTDSDVDLHSVDLDTLSHIPVPPEDISEKLLRWSAFNTWSETISFLRTVNARKAEEALNTQWRDETKFFDQDLWYKLLPN